MKPCEFADLTLTEALLFTLLNEKPGAPGTTQREAAALALRIRALPAADRIALARIRSGSA